MKSKVSCILKVLLKYWQKNKKWNNKLRKWKFLQFEHNGSFR